MFEVKKAQAINIEAKDRIIVALDVETAACAREIIAELRGEVGAFKIGLQLFTAAGASFVKEVIAAGIKVFLDVKFYDIPNTVAAASVEVARLGVWMFNIHALGGGEMMRNAVGNVREFCEKESLIQPKIIGVTILTSFAAETLPEIGLERKISDEVLNLARLTAKSGLDGIVASPLEVDLIRENIDKKDFLIVTPGIRISEPTAQNLKLKVEMPKIENQSGTIDDQRRVMSAGRAIRAGSDYLVIGRPILRAADRIQAVREIVKEIETQ